MKRKLDDDDNAVEAKKAKLDIVVPLEGSVSLLQLAVLQKALGSYCISISGGIAIPESECFYCARDVLHSNTCKDVDKLLTEKARLDEDIKYNVYVLTMQLSRHGDFSSISVEKNEDSVTIIFHDLTHLSWFAVQFLLCEGPVHSVACDLTSQKMSVTYTRVQRDIDYNDDILREIMLKYQKLAMQLLSHGKK